ncbi:MAG: sigma factor-like helix-turn-helix DNA-binding protein, partial [Acidimicrobiales bacterium]
MTRLSLDYLRSARVRRERYVGPWLPEPLVDAESWLGPLETLEEREQLSLATLALLERLSPRQRAVVLREAFDYPYELIARVLDSSPDACRQTHHRAKVRLGDDRPVSGVDPEVHRRLLDSLLAVLGTGELDQLERILAADVVLVTDGGGQVTAAR